MQLVWNGYGWVWVQVAPVQVVYPVYQTYPVYNVYYSGYPVRFVHTANIY